ncbi:MAG: adenylate/guanylate cyclase domain-containing protein, partial [Geminicoccaceae bacterium]
MSETASAEPNLSSDITEWLLGEAKTLPRGPVLLKELGARLNAAGLPLARISFHVRTLHPQLYGIGFYWYRGNEDVRVFEVPHGLRETDLYRRSPIRLIFDEGACELRQPLSLEDDAFDFELYAELKAERYTDYLALPLVFTDGKVHCTTWVTDREGGFTEAHIQQIRAVLPIFSLLIEIHLNRRIAINLLDTYVGRQAGERILA